MPKKIKSAKRVNEFESLFKCPFCENSMRVVNDRSLICAKKHTFDFAKQGYVNLLPRPSNSHYTKELFEARHKIIMESNLYTSMHKTITKMIKEHMDVAINPFTVLDLGCGEGSHLQKIVDECKSPAITGIGLDISKESIIMASKKYKDSIWLIGDLAKSPLVDESVHVILNIFSPSNYKEFKRTLVQDGLVIKIVPRPNYLKELREFLFNKTEKEIYRNDKIVSLFKKHFYLLDVFSLSYTMNLNQAELKNLVQMTPLAWSSDKGRINTYINQDSAEVTIDLDILIGVNK
ncbi:methyltransferase domain-containing protein (plasmid) [Priestia megaterium]|uniref:Methyltransferase domain protein n=1 Tax=Priestia megaterium (strain ATCC 14581 / DSM 32 / CCUG 1817 / JCM 2506 / NBRC 15308 / NCIMB 9376 / NCTC 10342 / NRRL B-14308 / VKM B-512 / Ford 19) TaxID=1348623 RepID=A0A0B6A949_PRIM2|nr:methyltransferase domain-containing protein [Priestia megaterium]AJI20091.1 methyltransferase domain protein [Priestia megaterium NBRC 15308 = ATCC 14581]KFM94748.1 methyltransferase domain protein [Priestia megaterium]KGJ80475.1 SAM-dependent methyltransferase [Priestia megaterium NBRC 15308 = ATCC 14581]MDR4231576.1 methyltransferase domain-containing protein [Priestia megaterium]MED3810294.1 methyltransferase domain-containing protein [Priestia megaterium]